MSVKIRLVDRATDTQQHPTLSHRWLLFLTIVLLIFGLVGWFFLSTRTELDVLKRFFRYSGVEEDYGEIALPATGLSAVTLADDCLGYVTQEGLSVYYEDGSQAGQCTTVFASPAIKANCRRFLAYDIGGRGLLLADNAGEISFQMEADAAVYDADLAENGSVCVLTEGTGSRAVLNLYSRRGKLLFRRISKSNYLNTCAVSPDGGYVAATTLGQESISFSSSVQIFDTSSEDAFSELSLGTQLIYELEFLDNQTLCALGESSLLFFSADGVLLGEYASEKGTPIAYSFGGEDFVAVLFDLFDAGSRYALVTLDKSGNVIATTAVDDVPLSLSACGRYTALLTQGELRIYNDELYLQNRTSNTGWVDALVRSDGTVCCLGGDFSKLYIP